MAGRDDPIIDLIGFGFSFIGALLADLSGWPFRKPETCTALLVLTGSAGLGLRSTEPEGSGSLRFPRTEGASLSRGPNFRVPGSGGFSFRLGLNSGSGSSRFRLVPRLGGTNSGIARSGTSGGLYPGVEVTDDSCNFFFFSNFGC